VTGWRGVSRRRRPQAGAYAEARFRLLRRRWRRRVLPRVALVVAPIATVTFGVSVAADGWVAWVAAVWFGAAASFWFYALDAVPQHIERWAVGADGERRTEKALRRLERVGWHFLHDLDRPGAGNVDHLAIGPGGVYVLDSKAWRGVVTVDSAGATVTPRDDPEAAWTATGQQRCLPLAATAVARALAAGTGRSVPAPRAVAVLWAPFPQQHAVSRSVDYVAGDHIADWLLGQPRQLHREHVAQLVAAAHTQMLADQGGSPATAPVRG
jgi:hypothetical protein